MFWLSWPEPSDRFNLGQDVLRGDGESDINMMALILEHHNKCCFKTNKTKIRFGKEILRFRKTWFGLKYTLPPCSFSRVT